MKNEIENLEESIDISEYQGGDGEEDKDEEEEENKNKEELNYLLNTFIKKLNLFYNFIEKFNLLYQKYISQFLIIPSKFDIFIENFDITIFGKYKPLLMKRKKSITENVESFYNIANTQKLNKI